MLSSKIAKTVPEIETCQQCIKMADEIQYSEIPNYALVVKEKYQLHQWNDELVTQLSNKQLIHTGATEASYLSRKKKKRSKRNTRDSVIFWILHSFTYEVLVIISSYSHIAHINKTKWNKMADKTVWNTNARIPLNFNEFQLSPKINARSIVKMYQLVEI